MIGFKVQRREGVLQKLWYRIVDSVSIILYPGLASRIDAVSALVDCGEELLMVDSGTGLPGSLSTLLRNIIEAGGGARKLRYLINTHSHVNNAGGDYWVREVFKPLIVAHKPDSRAIETGDPAMTASEELGIPFKPVPVGLELGEESWSVPECSDVKVTVLHTPGHTPGSISVYVESARSTVLIVGDALGSLSSRWKSSEDAWWRSLEKIKSLEASVLCTSISCMRDSEAREFIRMVESEGPIWING